LKKRFIPNFLKNKSKREDTDKSCGDLNGNGNMVRGRRALSKKESRYEK